MKRNACALFMLVLTALVMVCFAACSEQQKDTHINDNIYQLTLAAQSAEELAQLEQYPNLQTVDLRGSSCYDAIVQYVQTHPQVAVSYDVELGGTRYDNACPQLLLEDGVCTYDELLANLKYLPQLTQVQLPATTLGGEQLSMLTETYPDIAFDYTVVLLGQEYAADTTELDLSAADPSQIEQIAASAAALLQLTDVRLMAASGTSSFSRTDVKRLMDALPGVTVHYAFQLFGKTISTTDERVEYVNVRIGNEGVPQIREALDILPNCTYFKLDRCGIDDKTMEKLRDDYTETKIVWRVYFGYCNCLTDVEMLRCTGRLKNENMDALKYCTDVKYIDFGHNFGLSNFDFLNYMPKLEIVIIVDSDITTLEGFANCENLQWLEIVNCQKITDLSPLANCKNLKGLNISANYNINDLTPLYDLDQMERLFLGNQDLPAEEVEAVREALPNTWITLGIRSTDMVSYNYSFGWRLDEDGSRADWYLFVREIFRYDDNYYNHYQNDSQ